MAKRSIRCSALIAKDSFEAESAAVSDAARRKILFVGDQLQSHNRKMFEGQLGERSDSLCDQSGAASGCSAPIADL
jgi:hypothetical protein